jgi:hypothetical protein
MANFKLRAALLTAAFLGGLTTTRASEHVTRQDVNPTTVRWRIDEPNVKQRLTEYRSIRFRPGDAVTVTAGGCAQTGGAGKTWKRYVDPQGPNSDRLYHGLVWIPGAMPDLQRLQGVVGRRLTIPQGVDPAQLYLRLGYEDDNYSDNGYWGREGDDGTGNQCRGLGNAFVVLTVESAPTHITTQPAPMDLVWDAVDDNAIPLNPRWGWQVTHAGAPPDPHQLCPKGFQPPCTTQAPSVDTPGFWAGLICSAGATTDIHGHVNWMPATFEGTLTWDGHSNPLADDDYNFRLTPPNQAGLTTANHGALGLEFDSDETIDHFDTPWWDSFHRAVDRSDRDARTMVDGRFAIVTGLMGLDCEHSCPTELHPVYAMAIRVKDDPADETWAVFVRNWGNEGFCSQSQHYLDLLGGTYTLRLPWRGGASDVTITRSQFKTSPNARVSGPSLAYGPYHGVVLTFTLPRPEDRGRINGEVHLRWAGINTRALLAEAQLLSQPAPAAAPEHKAEDRLEALLAKMTPTQRQGFQATVPKKALAPDTVAMPVAAPVLMREPRAALLAARQGVPRVRAVIDGEKATREQRKFEAMRKSFGGQLPGYNIPAGAPR